MFARATLSFSFAQTLLRNLSSHALSTSRAFRLLDVTSFVVEVAIFSHVHLYLSRAIFLYVDDLMH